jgi:hypothetical protein
MQTNQHEQPNPRSGVMRLCILYNGGDWHDDGNGDAENEHDGAWPVQRRRARHQLQVEGSRHHEGGDGPRQPSGKVQYESEGITAAQTGREQQQYAH